MKTIEQAKELLSICNAEREHYSNFRSKWKLLAMRVVFLHEACSGCCAECSTKKTLRWVWPELENYSECITFERWVEYLKKHGLYKGEE